MWPDYFTGPLGGLAPAGWDLMTANRLYSSRQWLKICAQDDTITAGAVHTSVSGAPPAAVPVAMARDEPNPFYRWSDELAARGLPAPPPTGLLVGPHRGYQTHLLAQEGADPEDTARAVLSALADLDGVAADIPRIAMFLTTPDVVALQSAGVPVMPVLLRADAWFAIPEGGWPAWLESIGAGRRAALIRREERRFAAAGYRVTETVLADWISEVGQLLSNTEARYGHAPQPAHRISFLRRMATVMGDSARMILISPPGEPPVGYCLYYRWGDTVFLRSAGFDYARLRNAAEYFNVVYYLPLRIAAREGARWVHAGIEATEAKVVRGATLRPLWMLDLSLRSTLLGRDADVLAANARLSAQIAALSPAVRKAWPPEEDSDLAAFGLS